MDCDPGLDDALAILLALGSQKIDVKAIVATFGNVALSQTKNNLLKILSFFKRAPSLGFGSRGPLNGSSQEARHVHGQDGLAGLSQRERGELKKGAFKNGIDLIIHLALSRKVDTIIATGPLTDLAEAIRKEPNFLKNLDEIIIMGGAVFTKGNVTPYAEFNFHCDPLAAGIVLNAAVKKRLVSLDVTHKALLKPLMLEPLKKNNSPLADFITCIADYSIGVNKKRGFDGAPMHDPLAVGIAIEEGIGEYEDLRLDVETKGKERGMVVVKKGKPNTRFCKRVDAQRFFKLFLGTLEKLGKKE